MVNMSRLRRIYTIIQNLLQVYSFSFKMTILFKIFFQIFKIPFHSKKKTSPLSLPLPLSLASLPSLQFKQSKYSFTINNDIFNFWEEEGKGGVVKGFPLHEDTAYAISKLDLTGGLFLMF